MKPYAPAAAALTSMLLAAFLVFALAPSAVFGFSGGNPVGGTGCNQLDGFCHALQASDPPMVEVVGPAFIAPGDTATYTLIVEQINAGAGLNVAIEGAELGVVDQNTRLLVNLLTQMPELTHSNGRQDAPVGNKGDWEYDFDVIVPEEAEVGSMLTLFFAGNAFNGNGVNDPGDIWNTGTLNITVPEPGAPLLRAAALAALALLATRTRRRARRA